MATTPVVITAVRASHVRGVRMGEGLVTPWSRDLHTTRDYLAVRIDTDAGVWGLALDGDWAPIPMTAEVVHTKIAPHLIGRSVFDLVAHTELLSGVAAPGRYHFIEVALWDIIGKVLDKPLYKLWGGRDDRVIAYASTVHYGKTPAERGEDCKRYLARGYRAVKLRLSEDTVEEDLELVASCRSAVGDDLTILVDANQASRRPDDPRRWSLQRALDTARGLAELKVGWLEEPLSYAMIDESRKLARVADVPIAGGEGKRGLQPYWQVLHEELYNILQPDPVTSGTPTTLLQIVNLADAAGMPVAFHHGKSGVGMLVALHMQAALGFRKYLEVMDDPGYWNADGFQVGFKEPIFPEQDGFVRCPQGPGLGAEWDPEWLNEHQLAD